TSASSTSQDLKLRLFFASVPRAGGRLASGRPRGEDFIVEWGKLDEIDIADQAAGLYKQWLKDVKSHAPAMLADQVVPVRFTVADIRRMVGNLPEDKTVLATLEDLAKDLRAADLGPDAVKDAVKDAAKRLRRYLAGQDKPSDPIEIQHRYRQRVCQLRLLADDGRLPPQLKGSLYDQLLRVAFGPTLTYDGFCDIEESVGFPLHTSLRTALAKFPASDWLGYLLAREGQPGFRGGRGFADGTAAPAGEPVDDVITSSGAGMLRQRHGAVVLDWALLDLGRRGVMQTELLAARGYLAPACEYLFRDDSDTQVTQLKRVLRLAFGGLLGKPQIDYVLGQPRYLTTPALGRAVTAMAAGGRCRRYAEELLRQASLRARGVPAWEMSPRRRPAWLRWPRRRNRKPAAARLQPPDLFDQPHPAAPAPASGPRNHVLSTDSPWPHPKTLGIVLVIVLALFALAYLGVVLVIRGG
ncbi:MAG: hypothetical protein ACRDOI_28595, partial [Trebonia sp.]